MNGSQDPVAGATPDANYREPAAAPDYGQAQQPLPPPRGRVRQEGWIRDRFHPFDPRSKSAGLACFLSLMPGLGQVYVGYYLRGFVHVVVVGSVIALLASGTFREITPILGIFLPFFWLYNIVDAGRRAALYNEAMAGSESLPVPPEAGLPATGGSLVAGLALVGVGFIFLANTAWGVSLQWIEDWWPVAPIMGGLYLVIRSLQERSKGPARKEGV